MTRVIQVLLIMGATAITTPCIGDTQAVAQASVVRSNSDSVLEHELSLDMTSVSLTQALATISKNANVILYYNSSLFPKETRVTVRAARITMANALTRVLKGTGLEYKESGEGRISIVTSQSAGRFQGVITGKVTDAKTGRGIAGASVFAADVRGALSDDHGWYRLAGVSPGTHTVTVRLVGYAKQSRSVTVSEGATVTTDFKLEPSANVLDQVVVTGTVVATELKAVPSAITVVTAKQIEERGIIRIDQLFRGDIPGLFALNMGTAAQLGEVTMFSRGATDLGSSAGASNGTNPIKTYVDGVELTDPKYLSQIDPKSIERIEIITGPQASTIYGSNAINGVMQIFTKRGVVSKPQVTLGMTSGVVQNNSNTHLAPSYIADTRVSGTEGKWSYNVGGLWQYQGAWTPSMKTQIWSANGGGRMELSKLTADVSARQARTQNKKHGSVTQYQEDLATAGVWKPTGENGLPFPEQESVNGQTLGFNLGYRPLSWWSHELVLGNDVSVSEYLRTAAGYSSRTDTTLYINNSTTSSGSQRYTTIMQVPLSPLARLNLTIGAEHRFNKGSSWGSSNTLSLNGSIANPTVTRTKPNKNSGLFLQGQILLKDALFLTYGVRTDWNPNFGEKARVLPGRYGVSYTHDIGTLSAKIRGSYGRSIRPPSAGKSVAVTETNTTLTSEFGQFNRQLPNPELGPEFQQGGEGGVELYFGSRGSLVVTRYNQTVADLISTVNRVDSVRSLLGSVNAGSCSTLKDSDGYCYRYQLQNLNVGSIRNQGWELQGSINTGPLTTRGTYSWTKSRVIGITSKYNAIVSNPATGLGFERGRPFDFLPEHTWYTGITYANAKGMVSFSLNGLGMLYTRSDALIAAVTTSNRLNSTRPRIFAPDGYRALRAGYATADLNVTHRLSYNMDALLRISNLANYYANDFNNYFASMGRQSNLGVRLRW